MRLAVTGASGFLGRYVVAAALNRGHRIHAFARPTVDPKRLPWSEDERVSWYRRDLRSQVGLVEALKETDAVAHVAAVVGGDLYTQLSGTVVATENLLHAMHQAKIPRLVLVSSFSVYEYLHKRTQSVLDETSPLEDSPGDRDAYCLTKLLQEQLARRFCKEEAIQLTVVRPGIIFGPDRLWTACLGARAGDRWWIRVGAWARLPLSYVEHCAEAIVLCAESEEAVGETFNVVDDEQPSHRRYIRMLRKRVRPKPHVIPVSWTAARIAARTAWAVNNVVFSGSAKVPSILVPARLHARCKPLRYSNRLIKEKLGWEPRFPLADALDRSLAPGESGSST